MSKRKIIYYNPKLKEFARQLRNDSTRTEIFLLDIMTVFFINNLHTPNPSQEGNSTPQTENY